MQNILRYINSIEGVIGSAVFNESGTVICHTFPPLIDTNLLKAVASQLLECSRGLQIDQSLDFLDLRYTEGRIIVKAFPGALLCLLCAKNIKLQVLTITLNLAVKKLRPMFLSSTDL